MLASQSVAELMGRNDQEDSEEGQRQGGNLEEPGHVSSHVVPIGNRHTHRKENDSGGKNQEIRCEQEPNPANESVKKTIRIAHPHPLV